jgi:hypothetical protein
MTLPNLSNPGADEKASGEQSFTQSAQPKVAFKHLNGAGWQVVSGLLTGYQTVDTLAKKSALPSDQVEALLQQHSGEIRTSLLNTPEGETLYILRDTGIIPRVREVLAIAQLAFK